MKKPRSKKSWPGGVIDWRQSLAWQVESLGLVLDRVDPRKVEETLDLLRNCRGLIVFTGTGQDALLASKLASTYCSLSIRATGLDVTAMLHGGLGVLAPGRDLVVAVCTATATDELRQLFRCVGSRTKVLAVHTGSDRALGRLATAAMQVPVPPMPESLDAESIASVCILSLVQAFGVHIASERGLVAEDFGRTHPGGVLGQLAARAARAGSPADDRQHRMTADEIRHSRPTPDDR